MNNWSAETPIGTERSRTAETRRVVQTKSGELAGIQRRAAVHLVYQTWVWSAVPGRVAAAVPGRVPVSGTRQTTLLMTESFLFT